MKRTHIKPLIFTAILLTGFMINVAVKGQSFILQLQYNPMSFKNVNRTVIYDPGSNGGLSQGAKHKYSNVITKDGITVYAIMTLVEVDDAFITMFDDDAITGEENRFQPRIGAYSGGGEIVYQLEFFNTADDQPVFIYDYYMTGIDNDGNSSSNREYTEVGGYTSYQVNNPTGLTISTNGTTGRTRFLGISTSLAGVTFDNSASFIANFSNPNNKISFVLGQTAQNAERFHSVQFGIAGGAFSNPVVVNNPLPLAIDDVGVTVSTATGGTSVNNVLDNDLYDGSPVVPFEVVISLISAASDPGVVLNTSTGAVTVAAGTPVGTYTLIYQICMVASPGDCDVATVTVTVNNPVVDTDGDGVPDPDDDYPSDPDRAFNNYYPASGNGSLAYEDLWPGQGDYDFNDLVLDFRFKMVTNADNKLVEVFGTFIIKAFGASYHNGFGFQLPNGDINVSDITVTGYQHTAGYVTIGANGLETGQSKPTVIVFENCYDLMAYPGSGIGVNTTLGAPYIQPDTIQIYMDITDRIYTLTQLDIEDFNPFLIVNKVRGHEIHLPDFPPTDLMETSLFGQMQDDSNPLTDRYFKNSRNLPWAIQLYEDFEYPQEKNDIVTVYYHFDEWANSSGTAFPDWYQDNPGYRNNSLLY